MYTLTIDGRTFYDPRKPQYALESPILDLAANQIGTLTFTIYDSHPEYNNIVLRQSLIRVYFDGTIDRIMRPIKRRLNFKGGAEYTCEEATGRLNDLFKRPVGFTGTAAQMIELCIQSYTDAAAGTGLVAPAAYIRSLWPITHLKPASHIGSKSEAHIEGHETVVIVPNTGPAVTELNKILAVLGYWGNTYIPPTLEYNESKVLALMRKHGIESIDNLPGSDEMAYFLPDPPPYGNQHLWDSDWNFNQAHTHNKLYDALVEDFEELLESLPEDDDALVELDNAEPSSEITFYVGSTPASGDSFTVEAGDYTGYWDYMQQHIVEPYGGYIHPVWGVNSCTLNYYNDSDLPLSGQSIKFAENMSDLYIDTDSEDVYSSLIPIGKDGLTVNVYNDGVDYIIDANGEALYGLKEQIKEWPEIDDGQVLLDTAKAWLSENAVRLKDQINVSAYDLIYAGADVSRLRFMTRVPIKSELHWVDDTYLMTAATIPLDSPAAGNFELSGERDSLTAAIHR